MKKLLILIILCLAVTPVLSSFDATSYMMGLCQGEAQGENSNEDYSEYESQIKYLHNEIRRLQEENQLLKNKLETAEAIIKHLKKKGKENK